MFDEIDFIIKAFDAESKSNVMLVEYVANFIKSLRVLAKVVLGDIYTDYLMQMQ